MFCAACWLPCEVSQRKSKQQGRSVAVCVVVHTLHSLLQKQIGCSSQPCSSRNLWLSGLYFFEYCQGQRCWWSLLALHLTSRLGWKRKLQAKNVAIVYDFNQWVWDFFIHYIWTSRYNNFFIYYTWTRSETSHWVKQFNIQGVNLTFYLASFSCPLFTSSSCLNDVCIFPFIV